jgi:hypothetical protein
MRSRLKCDVGRIGKKLRKAGSELLSESRRVTGAVGVENNDD